MTAPTHAGAGMLAKALAAAGQQRLHPVVSATQFSAMTRDTGGATMNVHTREFTTIGSEGYGVGGMSSPVSKRRIPTREAHGLAGTGEMSLGDVLGHERRIRNAMPGKPTANLGSWHTGNGSIAVDASEVEPDRAAAIRKGQRRNEYAIFDYKSGQDINLK